MKQRILDVVSTLALLIVLGLAAAILMPRAYADMIPTPQGDQRAQPADDRARVKAMLERPEVVREMQKMGIPPEKAAARVDAMSDVGGESARRPAERAACGRRGCRPRSWLLIIIVILLIVIII